MAAEAAAGVAAADPVASAEAAAVTGEISAVVPTAEDSLVSLLNFYMFCPNRSVSIEYESGINSGPVMIAWLILLIR